MKKKTHVEILEKLVIRYGIKDVFFQRVLDVLTDADKMHADEFLKDLIEKYGVEDTQLCEVLAEVFHTSVVELNRGELSKDIIDPIGFDICYKYNLIPFKMDHESIHLACFNPGNLEAADIVQSLTRKKPVLVACPYEEVRKAIGSMYPMETDLSHYFDRLGVSRAELDNSLLSLEQRFLQENEPEEVQETEDEYDEPYDYEEDSPEESTETKPPDLPPPLPNAEEKEKPRPSFAVSYNG